MFWDLEAIMIGFLMDLPPPAITAKSWSITDGRTGEVLFGKGENDKREMASVTKLMTCFVTLQISQRIKLDMRRTMLKVSKTAAAMGGTTAKLRTGDELSVWDLLHGLMLPSGNDAAMCLAENFGEYLYEVSLMRQLEKAEGSKEEGERRSVVLKPEERRRQNPIKYFIQEMN